MKKIIISACLLFSAFSQAQLEIAPYDFENGDTLEGWTIVDQDNANSGSWALQNNYYSSIMGSEPITVLGLHNLGGPGSADEWAILPAQDLSYYTGIHFNVSYLQGFFQTQTNANLLLYALISEETPTVDDFVATAPIATLTLTGDYNDPPAALTVTADVPQMYNAANVHFALVYRWTQEQGTPPSEVIDLTKVAITADAVAGIGENTPKITAITQNPVNELLNIQLGQELEGQGLQVSVYNAAGILVKTSGYNESGINVSNLSSGIYFVTLSAGATNTRLKFIKA